MECNDFNIKNFLVCIYENIFLNHFLLLYTFRDNLLCLKVYFSSAESEIYSHKPKYSVSDKLSKSFCI